MAALMGRGRLTADLKAAARDVMRGPVVTVEPSTPVATAAQRMLTARHKVLPITEADGRLLGAVDRADLLRALRTASAEDPRA
jgi:CBS domain-containing protein